MGGRFGAPGAARLQPRLSRLTLVGYDFLPVPSAADGTDLRSPKSGHCGERVDQGLAQGQEL